MKVAVFEKPGTMHVTQRPMPVCGPDDIIIKVHACGICGGDIRNFFTGLRYGIESQVMGHEFSGTVVEKGKRVTKFALSDRVAVAPDVSCGICWYCTHDMVNLCENHRMIGTHWPGGFAEYVHLPQEVLAHGFVHHIPEGVSLTDACLSEPASSVIAAQERIGLAEGDSILILGDGPIGCLHIEVAKSRGAKTILLAGRSRLEAARQFGPDCLLNYEKDDILSACKELTDGRGVDYAICANASVESQQIAVDAVRKRGKVVVFGGAPKKEPWTILNSNTIHYNEIEVIGTFSYQIRHHIEALKALQMGNLHPDLYFTKTVGLDDIVQGFMAAKRREALKVLVKP
jgi:L-iditol 2-dehydrogenase